ncbi:MAG: hypothetical protein KTR32_06440 [Granulosicoccus sp.]|nr:hypothetical protein [Granulosicoccus sp.]
MQANTHTYCWLICLLLLIGGCSDSDSASGSDPDQADPAQATTDDNQTDPGIAAQPDDTNGDTNEEETEAASDPTALTDPDTPPLQSPLQPGSDLERLISGLNRLVSITLLDLNDRLSSGQALSSTEENCLGSFEPGNGQVLLGFNCDATPLAAPIDYEAARVSVTSMAFTDTAACREDLFNALSEACTLQTAELAISTEWVRPEPPELPYPIDGAEISYAPDEPVLLLQSLSDSPSEPFSCTVDLVSALPVSATEDCDTTLPMLADRLDMLVPVQNQP